MPTRREFLRASIGTAVIGSSVISEIGMGGEHMERETLDQELAELRGKFKKMIGGVPEPPPLDLKVKEKRTLNGEVTYEEWKVDYQVETSEMMPEPAGQRVPAFLLIPRDSRFRPPYPAMVCFHQCNMDCLLGKDAVIGRVLYRPEQAYGYELVSQGFVVLAPDSLNCGERNIVSIRKADERVLCHSELAKFEKPYPYKTPYEASRAVDVLQSFDFVDSSRIGAVGHSMGAGHTFLALAFDERFKAGITSCGGSPYYLPLIAPRFLASFQGALEWMPADQFERIQEAFQKARRFWEVQGSDDQLMFRKLNYAHFFPEEFKREAYARLKTYFQMRPVYQEHLLKDILGDARDKIDWMWKNDTERFPEIREINSVRVRADRQELSEAFLDLFLKLQVKRPMVEPFKVTVERKGDVAEATCSFRCQNPESNDRSTVGYEGFRGGQVLYEHNATLRREYTEGSIRYVVSMPAIR